MTLSIRPLYRPARLSEMMDRLFDDPFFRNGFASYPSDAVSVPLDVQAKDDEYLVYAAVPGLSANDLRVEVQGNTLTLRGEVFAPANGEQTNWLLQERAYGKFSRTLTMPTELEAGKVEANLENGVLTLRLPKAETAKPKTITIKAK